MGKLIPDKFAARQAECEARFQQLKQNEEELNRLFIDIYGLRDEIVSLISYAVGCMFGRYSLDVEGLAYAGGPWDAGKYQTFLPDEDNCIPITDVEYFVGHSVEFVRVVYDGDFLSERRGCRL